MMDKYYPLPKWKESTRERVFWDGFLVNIEGEWWAKKTGGNTILIEISFWNVFLLWSENENIELRKKGICSNITGVTPPPPKDLAANLSRKQLHPNHCISQALDMFECLQGRISMLQFRAAVLFWWTIFCKRRQIQVLEQSELNLHISCVQACLHCTFFGFFRDKRSWWTLHPVKH